MEKGCCCKWLSHRKGDDCGVAILIGTSRLQGCLTKCNPCNITFYWS